MEGRRSRSKGVRAAPAVSKGVSERIVLLRFVPLLHVQPLKIHLSCLTAVSLHLASNTVSTHLAQAKRSAGEKLVVVLGGTQDAAAGAPLTMIDSGLRVANAAATAPIAGAKGEPHFPIVATLGAQIVSGNLADPKGVLLVVAVGSDVAAAEAGMDIDADVVVIFFKVGMVSQGFGIGEEHGLLAVLVSGLSAAPREVEDEAVSLPDPSTKVWIIVFIVCLPANLPGPDARMSVRIHERKHTRKQVFRLPWPSPQRSLDNAD